MGGNARDFLYLLGLSISIAGSDEAECWNGKTRLDEKISLEQSSNCVGGAVNEESN